MPDVENSKPKILVLKPVFAEIHSVPLSKNGKPQDAAYNKQDTYILESSNDVVCLEPMDCRLLVKKKPPGSYETRPKDQQQNEDTYPDDTTDPLSDDSAQKQTAPVASATSGSHTNCRAPCADEPRFSFKDFQRYHDKTGSNKVNSHLHFQTKIFAWFFYSWTYHRFREEVKRDPPLRYPLLYNSIHPVKENRKRLTIRLYTTLPITKIKLTLTPFLATIQKVNFYSQIFTQLVSKLVSHLFSARHKL